MLGCQAVVKSISFLPGNFLVSAAHVTQPQPGRHCHSHSRSHSHSLGCRVERPEPPAHPPSQVSCPGPWPQQQKASPPDMPCSDRDPTGVGVGNGSSPSKKATGLHCNYLKLSSCLGINSTHSVGCLWSLCRVKWLLASTLWRFIVAFGSKDLPISSPGRSQAEVPLSIHPAVSLSLILLKLPRNRPHVPCVSSSVQWALRRIFSNLWAFYFLFILSFFKLF